MKLRVLHVVELDDIELELDDIELELDDIELELGDQIPNNSSNIVEIRFITIESCIIFDNLCWCEFMPDSVFSL